MNERLWSAAVSRDGCRGDLEFRSQAREGGRRHRRNLAGERQTVQMHGQQCRLANRQMLGHNRGAQLARPDDLGIVPLAALLR